MYFLKHIVMHTINVLLVFVILLDVLCLLFYT